MSRSVECVTRHKELGMNPKNKRVLALALALAEAPDELFERVYSIVFGAKTEWQRLIALARISEVIGQIEDHLPIEQNPNADGVLEVFCPKGKLGRKAYEHVLNQNQSVGPGSALLHIAASKGGSKLVITSTWDNQEDGHTYVAVYDRMTGAICPELVDDISATHTFLVRRK